MTTTTLNRRYILNQGLKTAAAISGMVLLPVLVHLVPFSGRAPLGAYLLPMFIAPLVAAFYLSPVGLAAAALIAPVLNHALTGMPAAAVLLQLIAELALFSLLLSWMIRNERVFAGMSVLAFAGAKLAVFAVGALAAAGIINLLAFTPFVSGLLTALPGLLVLLALERRLVHMKK